MNPQLLNDAASEIRAMRRRLEIFEARQETLHLVRRLLDAGQNPNGYGTTPKGEDIAYSLERAAEEANRPPAPPEAPKVNLSRWKCHKIVQAARITLIGGYFIRYDDGYESYSPKEAFESGYAREDAGPE